MTQEEDHVTLQETIDAVQELIVDLAEAVVEQRGEQFDPVHAQLTQFDVEELKFIELFDELKRVDNMCCEVSFHSALSHLIKFKDEGNGFNQRQLAVLIDLAIYGRSIGAVHIDLPHLLLIRVLDDFTVQSLLEFWGYFEHRVSQFNHFGAGEQLVIRKHPGIPTMMALNRKLEQFNGNNEPARDVLKSKILMFTSKIFSRYENFLLNPKLQQNLLTQQEHKYTHSKSSLGAYELFWKLQDFFASPTRYLTLNRFDELDKDIRSVLESLKKAEKSGKEVSSSTSSAKRGGSRGISESDYYREDLSSERKEELKKLFDEKVYTPTFFMKEERFADQMREDSSLRKVFYFQLFFTIEFILYVLDGEGGSELGKKNADIDKLRNSRTDFRPLAVHQDTVKSIVREYFPELSFVLSHSEIEESHNLKQAGQGFKSCIKIVQEYVLDDRILRTLEEMKKERGSYWATHGTPQITNHWKLKTGMELLEKDPKSKSTEAMEKKIEEYKFAIQEDPQSRELNTWKALRLARGVSLSKFHQVNQSVGLDGLFDGSLKKKYDEERETRLAAEDARREEEEEEAKKQESEMEEKRQLLAKQREEIAKKKAEDMASKHSEEPDLSEEERKRKASSQDAFDKESKRQKLELSSQQTEAIDY